MSGLILIKKTYESWRKMLIALLEECIFCHVFPTILASKFICTLRILSSCILKTYVIYPEKRKEKDTKSI